jgi:Recombination endonuclease VII
MALDQEKKRASRRASYWRHRDENCARMRAARLLNPEKAREQSRAYYRKHHVARRAAIQKKYRENPDLAWASKLKRYGLDVVLYEKLLNDQGGVCAVCRTNKTAHAGSKRLAVDHDHLTGKVRGLLCGRCNKTIGMLRDDPVLIRALAYYLECHNARYTRNAS